LDSNSTDSLIEELNTIEIANPSTASSSSSCMMNASMSIFGLSQAQLEESIVVGRVHKSTASMFGLTQAQLEESVVVGRIQKKCVRFDGQEKTSRSSSLNSSQDLSRESSCSIPEINVLVKPILKRKICLTETTRLLKKEQKRQDAVEKLKQRSGSVLYKYIAKGDKHKRLFYLSEDGTELQWKKHKISRGASWIDLASVRQMIIGPRTERFRSFDWINGKPWLCFSLVTDSRTVDIECRNVEEFDIWFQGLNALVPTSRDTRYSRGRILWQRALIKSIQISVRSKKNSLEAVWQDMVNAAYRNKSSGLEKFLVSE